MDTATLIDRRNAGTPLRNFSVDSQAITWRDGEDGPQHSLALADVRQVRLAVEMAGQNSQVVCRVSASDGREIAFGSMRWAGIGQWEANARDFRDFLRALHVGLDDQAGPGEPSPARHRAHRHLRQRHDDRGRPRRSFRRITGSALRELLPEANRAVDAPAGAGDVGGDASPVVPENGVPEGGPS